MGHEILVSYDRNPLRGYKPKAFAHKIATMLRGRAVEVYLFGSFNTDKFSRHSDVDLFIITDTEVPFVERPLLFDDLLDAFPSLDILVYTPDEFRDLTSDPSPGFWSSAVANMKRIV